MKPEASERFVIPALGRVLLALADIVGGNTRSQSVERVTVTGNVPGRDRDMGLVVEIFPGQAAVFETPD